jgi:decaprenyl-phosphate phosphoribosyltransferase
MVAACIALLRPHQWVKNAFLFLPLFFAGHFFEIAPILRTLAGFVAFCLVSSAVYILNDYIDIPFDKLHPEKCKRPLAAGLISKPLALGLLFSLSVAGLALAAWLDTWFLAILAFYFLMNLAYSLKLKHVAIFDISIIATGFVLRVHAGGIVGAVPISQWIVIMTFLLALFLALAKRRDDVIILHEKGDRMRPSVDGYNLEFVNSAMTAMAAVIIVSYVMYTVSPEVEARMGSPYLYGTTFFVILGLLRYFQISMVYKKSGSPTKALLKDKMLPLIVLGWIGSFFAIIYMR